MMNLMIYFIIKLSLNNCQNIFLSYSNNDESVKDNKFYNDFHLSHNKIFKEDKKINQTFNNYSKNIKINNILYNVTFNNISSFKDYNNNLIIYSPNPITIFIYGNLIINKEENVFKFKKNIFFYSIKEIDFQMNNITLEFKFKYKKIKRFKDLILKNKLNYTLYIPILSILDNELIPIIIKDIEKNLKKNLTLRYKEIFKNEEIQFYLANFFGEFDFNLINEKNGFCQSINNSERIFCPLSGIVSNKNRESKKNINGKKEFIEDINLLNFTQNENGLYINYFVFDQIFQFIHQNFYYFTLTNYNKPSYLPYMNVDYLKQFFHNIGSYYILSEQFSLEISIVNYEKVNLTNGYVNFNLNIIINKKSILFGFIEGIFTYTFYLDVYKINILIKTFNIQNFFINESVFRIKDKKYFIKKIASDWIDNIKTKLTFQEGIDFHNHMIYIVKYKNGKNGFYIKGKRNKYLPVDIN